MKNAEAKAAREEMLKNIKDMKVQLADIAAAKKKKKAANNSACKKTKACAGSMESQLTSDQRLIVEAEHLQSGRAKDSNKLSDVKEIEDSTKENVGVSVTAVIHRQDLPKVMSVSDCTLKDAQLVPSSSSGTGLGELKCEEKDRADVEKGSKLIQSDSLHFSSIAALLHFFGPFHM